MLSVGSKLKSLTRKRLVVFDFDETIVDCNSDSWVHKLLGKEGLPANLDYCKGQDYFEHVKAVQEHICRQGISEAEYSNCLGEMPVVQGIDDPLISYLNKMPETYDIIILSDANSFFIGSFLKKKGLEKSILTVLTNPARFTLNDQLFIEPFHEQDFCSWSPWNLCKGEALKTFIGKRMLDDKIVYDNIFYIGDGENDLCPSTKLSSHDFVFSRKGYALDRLCKKLRDGNFDVDRFGGKLPEVKASVVAWEHGREIVNMIDTLSKPSSVETLTEGRNPVELVYSE